MEGVAREEERLVYEGCKRGDLLTALCSAGGGGCEAARDKPGVPVAAETAVAGRSPGCSPRRKRL